MQWSATRRAGGSPAFTIRPLGRIHLGASVLLASAVIVGCAPTRLVPDLVYFPAPPSPARVVHLKSFNRLRDLVPARVRFVDLVRGLPFGPYVETPAGIAYRDGHLYVCDTGLGVVHDWDLTTGVARRIGQNEDILLSKPVAVAVGAEGTVYVADTDRGEVVAYPPASRTPRRFRPSGKGTFRPVAVAVAGHTLYVADIAEHRIDIFSTLDGSLVGRIGGVGSEPGKFYFPMGVAADDHGKLFVSDMMNGRVQLFDAGHKLITTMGRPGNRYGDMGKPRHLAVGPDGVIFIADAEFAHVHLFNTEGELLMLLGDPDDKPGGTPLPVGVAIAQDLPPRVASLVPDNFSTAYFLFVTNSTGSKRIGLFAAGDPRNRQP